MFRKCRASDAVNRRVSAGLRATAVDASMWAFLPTSETIAADRRAQLLPFRSRAAETSTEFSRTLRQNTECGYSTLKCVNHHPICDWQADHYDRSSSFGGEMRQLIDSTQIHGWFISTRRDAQELLPDLVRKLIIATLPLNALQRIRIPVGDDVTRPGFDGTVDTTTGSSFVPDASSVWEMGVSADPETKANSDYRTRVANPRGVDVKATAFVFVTPHPWDGKEDWAAERKAESVWRDVRVLDSTDLALWVETAPAVARWLARQIGIPIEGMRDIELFCAELVASSGPHVTPELVVGGRVENLAELRKWIESDAPSVVVEADSPEDATNFIAGAIRCLPKDLQESLVSRIIFADSTEALDYLSAVQATQFVIPTTPEARRRAKALGLRAVRLILPSRRSVGDGRAEASGTLIQLRMVRRQAVESALVRQGISTQRARQVAPRVQRQLHGAALDVS